VLIGTSRYRVDVGDGALSAADSRTVLARGLREAWAPLAQAGIRVIVLRDVPRPDFNVPDCIAQHLDELSQCAFDRAPAVWDEAPEVTAARAIPGALVIDLTAWICPGDRCPVVIGGVVVYRDTDHLTLTYVRSLTGAIAGPLVDALG
jgi:SGNH domain-containing protein